ncbi:hypothetical protein R1flu_024639 [Riccia fluitans]|uniref:Uncharacterized protein n=1 Tax=Riccia fluitans TaxID=41844 RepID=A0ABD1XVG8_9MARC
MGSYTVVPYYLVEALPSSDGVIEVHRPQYDDVEEDHVVLRVASCIDGVGVGGEKPSDIRVVDMGESSQGRQTRDAECLLQSLTNYYLFYLVGATSVFIPFITGQGPLHMLPWLLNLSGCLSLLQYACVRRAPGSTAIFFLATLHLTTGVWMLRRPTVSEATVTYLVQMWFLIHGTLKLWISLQVRKLSTWPALFASGLLSVLLAGVLHHLPSNFGLTPVDIYIRIELLFTGCAGALLLYSMVAIIINRK